jgi:PTH1 family peptidyl-tRNA hydrolase
MRLVGTRAHAGDGVVGSERVIVVKPLTYMNRSGQVVRELVSGGPVESLDRLLIVVDEAALPTGAIRLRPRGSPGGHNGLRSVEQALGTPEYPRMRIGVGPPPDGEVDLAEFVLERFDAADAERFVETVPEAVEAVECWMREGIETAMNRFNRRPAPE